jgi:hypothetical protein
MMYGDRVQMRDADVEHQYRTPYNLYRYLVDKQDGENAMTVDDIVAEFAKTKARATTRSICTRLCRSVSC